MKLLSYKSYMLCENIDIVFFVLNKYCFFKIGLFKFFRNLLVNKF